jgi:protein-disulfide isomerase-like protein with CxxC motif
MLYQSRFGDTGVRVVVGMAEHSQSAAMASKIAQGVEVDDGDRIARALQIQSVPSYIVMDKEGSKILDGQEGYAWVMEKLGR